MSGKPSTSKKPYKKKALKATWDSESESDEEVDTTNMCFMANESTSTYIPKPNDVRSGGILIVVAQGA